MTLTEFVEARVAETEATACGCETNEAGDIRCHRCGERVNVRCWNCKRLRGSGHCPSPRSPRVLAVCDAYREIVRLCAPPMVDVSTYSERRFIPGGVTPWAEPVLFALAGIWADHPDYRPEWRP